MSKQAVVSGALPLPAPGGLELAAEGESSRSHMAPEAPRVGCPAFGAGGLHAALETESRLIAIDRVCNGEPERARAPQAALFAQI